MSATNSTTHYELPSFLGSDKPAWLVDWNGAMATIDSAIYEAKQAADTAGTSASAVASDLATLSGTVSTQGSTISTLSDTLTTAVGNINTINGNINTINSLIGNGTPTTTDQTIIGAINEINAKVNPLINGTVVATVTADGVKTYGTILNELFNAYQLISSSLTDHQKSNLKLIIGDGIYQVHYISGTSLQFYQSNGTEIYHAIADSTLSSCIFNAYAVSDASPTSYTSNIVTSGRICKITC